jgi:hypothetical protein
MRTSRGDNELVSYLTLRRVVGVLGVTMPVVVAVWGLALLGPPRLLPSISDYYSLRTRDVLVGVLFAIAWFLYTYRGYDDRDDVAGNLACVFALGVALFPNSGTRLDRVVHFVSAASLFLVLAYFSLFLFTRTGGSPTPRKKIRNTIYRTCGITILVCIVLIALYMWTLADSPVARFVPVFWLETFALWAFGFAWFVKGETLFKDESAAPGTASREASSEVMSRRTVP